MGKKKDQKKSTKHASEGSGVEAEAQTASTIAEKKAPKGEKASASATKSGISTADIALRAYFISEKRRSQGLHGNEHHDWVEAERQLLAEKKKPKKKPVEA
jgi:hypothetical protein